MAIQVLIEPVANNGFRAATGEPHCLAAEGSSQAEALRKLGELLDQRLQNSSQRPSPNAEARTNDNPWVKFAGMFRGDPHFDKWQQAIEEYRREVDADPDYL
jgi:hypothetical protein